MVQTLSISSAMRSICLEETQGVFLKALPIVNLTSSKNGIVTLYAVWTPITYNIQFNGNGQESGSTSPQYNLVYDQNYQLSANGFGKTGYSFGGWKDSSGNYYRDRQQINNLTATNGGTIILYAQWNRNIYTLTLDANGSAVSPSSKQIYYGDTYELPTPAERSGYTFQGWYASESEHYNAGDSFKMPASDITLQAQWKENSSGGGC